MAGQKQIAANRRNAKKSTGPRTPAGLAVSRFNALRHGLRANAAFLPAESSRQLIELRERFLCAWQPQTLHQRRLVGSVACAQWKLLQSRRIHTQLLREAAETLSPRRHDRLRATFSRRQARIELNLRHAYDNLVKSIPAQPPQSRPLLDIA